MGAIDYLKRLGNEDDVRPTELTSIDIVWIEQRVTATLAENGIECAIERGFLSVAGTDAAPMSLAPLGQALLLLDRSTWSSYVWEWCANHVQGVPSRLDVADPIESLTPAGMDLDLDQLFEDAVADVEIDVPAVPDLLDLTLTTPAPAESAAPAPTPSTPPAALAATNSTAHGMTLAEALSTLTVRMVSDSRAANMPVHALVETAIPNMYGALSVAEDGWVTQGDLDAWGITREMALEMAENRISMLSPQVDIVFLDDATPVFVVETEGPDAASMMPYIEQHVSIPASAETDVTVAIANDHTLFVYIAPAGSSDAGESGLPTVVFDAVISESRLRPGKIEPTVFRWNDGELTPTAKALHRAAGRLQARLS